MRVHLIPVSISVLLVNRYCNARYSSSSSLLFFNYFECMVCLCYVFA